MPVLVWIVIGGLLMSAIALVGGITVLLERRAFQRLLLPLVAFASGSLMGGALLHMIPAAQAAGMGPVAAGPWVLAGFTVFLGLEQFLHWHHCARANSACRKPLTYLILIGDGLHNFLGGIAVGSAALIDLRLGVTTWIAAAAHEIPQELGDFAVLVHGGLEKRKALLWNVISGLTFPLGGVLAWALSFNVDIAFLIPFAAGNFIYIAASDLVPELNRHGEARERAVHVLAFVAGVLLMALIRLIE